MIEFSREGRTKGFRSGWTCLHGQTGKKDLEYGRNACLTRHTEYVEGVYERRKEKLTIKYFRW